MIGNTGISRELCHLERQKVREGLKGLMGKKVLGSREASRRGHGAVLGLILGVMGFLQLLCGEWPAGDPRGQQVAW